MDGGIVLGILAVARAQRQQRADAAPAPALAGRHQLVRRRRRSRGCAATSADQVEQPAGRPIEEIARSIRRLGGEFHGGHPGRSWVKSEAFRRAYDDALAEGCRALDVHSDLLDLDPGTDRDAERLRVEHLLAGAGLVLRRAA